MVKSSTPDTGRGGPFPHAAWIGRYSTVASGVGGDLGGLHPVAKTMPVTIGNNEGVDLMPVASAMPVPLVYSTFSCRVNGAPHDPRDLFGVVRGSHRSDSPNRARRSLQRSTRSKVAP